MHDGEGLADLHETELPYAGGSSARLFDLVCVSTDLLGIGRLVALISILYNRLAVSMLYGL